jgi:D-tagatose-1,6-bisphosphate aldolase subunit GatZ/KbaZ
MKLLLDLIVRHKAGEACGIYSVCSAHPLVIEATLRHALAKGCDAVLIEATSNQVNQYGGYTGMNPDGFRAFVLSLAADVGFPDERIILGGDHLGPNAWTALPSEEAMAKAEVMIDQYVAAGFRKIHLDCSMSCADDPTPLPEMEIAKRAARLCAVAEAAWATEGGEKPVYVIGTEVPVPGGAAEDLETLEVTRAADAQATIDMHETIFAENGLSTAWPRVIATVVQPGVEFDHRKVVDYAPEKATELCKQIETHPTIVFEAHSTDYQTPAALKALVEGHFAILKVGPGVTFALREALWALDAIEREIVDPAGASNFRATTVATMRADPRHWEKYYHSKGTELEIDLQYSLSDRIRYYWSDDTILAAENRMFKNLRHTPIPLPLLSQYMPVAYAGLRSGETTNDPKDLVMTHIASTLEAYHAACAPDA